MNEYEICYQYKHAVNKVQQVIILSELNLTDTDTIIQILKDGGVLNPKDMKSRICCRCGREYPVVSRKGLPVCPECRDVNTKVLELERRIQRNNAKIADYNRSVGRLINSSSKLREQINELKKGVHYGESKV